MLSGPLLMFFLLATCTAAICLDILWVTREMNHLPVGRKERIIYANEVNTFCISAFVVDRLNWPADQRCRKQTPRKYTLFDISTKICVGSFKFIGVFIGTKSSLSWSHLTQPTLRIMEWCFPGQVHTLLQLTLPSLRV